MALARRSSCGLGGRCDQWLSVFLAKETLLPGCVGVAPHLETGGAPPLQAPPLTGPIVFALLATALAWNLTDVAVLIAIGYGGFLRTMEALTLQRHQITAQGTCILASFSVFDQFSDE